MIAPFIRLPYRLERDPPPFEGQDIKSPESLIRTLIKDFSKPGDRVFDPFAGLGTTLFVAEELKRVPYGIEADQAKQEWVAGQLENFMNLRCGDAALLARHGFPKMDLVLTSPPYMAKSHQWNPLFGGDPKYAGYDAYLKRMGVIFKKIQPLLKKNASVIVQADNLPGKIYTPLVRDLSLVIGKTFRPVGEIVVAYDVVGKDQPNWPHTTCLIFRNSL